MEDNVDTKRISCVKVTTVHYISYIASYDTSTMGCLTEGPSFLYVAMAFRSGSLSSIRCPPITGRHLQKYDYHRKVIQLKCEMRQWASHNYKL